MSIVFPEVLYVAGPMTGLPELNYPAFFAAEARLIAAGFRVENPAINQLPSEALYTDYLRLGLAQLLKAGGVAVLDDWWRSGGARWEISTAGILHMPIRSVDEWIMLKARAA